MLKYSPTKNIITYENDKIYLRNPYIRNAL